jgi:hypothetical protein
MTLLKATTFIDIGKRREKVMKAKEAAALAAWKEDHFGSSEGFSEAYDVKIDYKEHPEACWNYGEDYE